MTSIGAIAPPADVAVRRVAGSAARGGKGRSKQIKPQLTPAEKRARKRLYSIVTSIVLLVVLVVGSHWSG